MAFTFPYIGNVILPTDELIFFRGVGIPPTSNGWFVMLLRICYHHPLGQLIHGPLGESVGMWTRELKLSIWVKRSIPTFWRRTRKKTYRRHSETSKLGYMEVFWFTYYDILGWLGWLFQMTCGGFDWLFSSCFPQLGGPQNDLTYWSRLMCENKDHRL